MQAHYRREHGHPLAAVYRLHLYLVVAYGQRAHRNEELRSGYVFIPRQISGIGVTTVLRRDYIRIGARLSGVLDGEVVLHQRSRSVIVCRSIPLNKQAFIRLYGAYAGRSRRTLVRLRHYLVKLPVSGIDIKPVVIV